MVIFVFCRITSQIRLKCNYLKLMFNKNDNNSNDTERFYDKTRSIDQ